MNGLERCGNCNGVGRLCEEAGTHGNPDSYVTGIMCDQCWGSGLDGEAHHAAVALARNVHGNRVVARPEEIGIERPTIMRPLNDNPIRWIMRGAYMTIGFRFVLQWASDIFALFLGIFK